MIQLGTCTTLNTNKVQYLRPTRTIVFLVLFQWYSTKVVQTVHGSTVLCKFRGIGFMIRFVSMCSTVMASGHILCSLYTWRYKIYMARQYHIIFYNI